jgi:protein ImuB
MRALAIAFAPPPEKEGRAEGLKEENALARKMHAARIAESVLHLGTTASISPWSESGRDSTNQSGVVLDITGCARLFGKTQEEGETAMAADAEARVNALGVPCRVAIADGPRVAFAVASFGGNSRIVVPPSGHGGGGKSIMANLPLVVLPLPEKTRAWIARLGVKRVSDLLALPRKELGNRLGDSEKDVFALAEGDDRAPLVPYVPPSKPEESVELDVSVESHEALAFVVKTLADRMGARLKGRGQAIAKMELLLSLDIAACTGKKGERARAEGVKREIHVEPLALPAPLADEKDLFTVLRARIERLGQEKGLEAPVRAVTLRATELVEKPARELALFSALPKAEGVLARLAGELFAEGCEVGNLGLKDTWDPRERSILVPLEQGTLRAMRVSKKEEYENASLAAVSVAGLVPELIAPEPTLVLEEPAPASKRDMKHVRFLSRVEAISWWRDRKIAFDRTVSKVGEDLACVEIDRATGGAEVAGYFD